MATLKDDLLDPAAYPPPRPARVELVQTHISWVFLGEHDVFKVKRPVALGFLDFSTAERRRAACDAEVTLNERLAPGVYLGVLPVRRTADGRHRVGGETDEGEVVDWAVHMRRLPEARRADTLLRQGALGGDALEALAARLVAFHAASRCDAETSRFGRPEALAVNVRENFAQEREVLARLRVGPGAPSAVPVLRAEEAEAIERWQLAVLRDQAAQFDARVTAGKVRDGHGDLRLEHVYLDAGPAETAGPSIAVLDCIEFNDRFRYADVAADLAFLSMDLAFHGRVDLAERLLARYAREANDFDLYGVIDFYEAYRAYVRGKIASMRATDDGASDASRHAAAADARRYFLLALSAGRRPLLSPSVVAVGGLLASGKSTVAGWLEAELGAPVVDADRTRKHLAGVGPTTPLPAASFQGAYDPAVTEQVYAEVRRRAGVVLASGRPVVLDASFRSVAMRRAARELAEAHGVPFRMVECRVPLSVSGARLAERERGEGVSDGRLGVFEDFCARFEPMTELSAEEHFMVDTTQAEGATLRQLRDHLSTWPPTPAR